MNAHVRLVAPFPVPEPVPASSAVLVPAGSTVVPAEDSPTCPECHEPLGHRKHPATYCSARCRAAGSRRRRLGEDVARLDAAEAALLGALGVVRDIRGDLARRLP